MSETSLDFDTEELARRYEQVSVERQFKAGQQLIDRLKIAPSECVLDIGCGTGRLAEFVADLVGPGGSVAAIDPLPLRIEIAEARRRPNLSFSLGNAYDLAKFSPETFDVVYMNAVFHWLADKPTALRQIVRVLKPGGRLGISTGDKNAPNPLQLVRERVLSHAPFDQYPLAAEPSAHRVSIGEMKTLLREAELKIERLETASFSRPELKPEAAIQFSEASSFGNFLGHLPEPLRAMAREQIVDELEKTDALAPTAPRRLRIIAIAHK